MKAAFYGMNFNDLQKVFAENSLQSDVATKLFNWHYKKKKTEALFSDISQGAIAYIESHLSFDLPKIIETHQSKDNTVKFLIELFDGHKVETVLIPFHNKYSICLSSQVGCAMNCSFCYTGTQGLKRSLSAAEIVGQYILAARWLDQNRPGREKILNIVFMGQGEPLHNFNAVKKACEIFLCQNGASIGSQKITVSTAGYAPGLLKWRDGMPQVNLALSLHSPYTTKRDELIPLNKKYPLKDVLSLIDQLPLQKKQFITYEYLLIKDFNDSATDASELGRLLQGKSAYINLIPFNPFPCSKYQRPSTQTVSKFKDILDAFKIPTLIRETKGDEVLAACGQLNSSDF